MGNWVKVYTRQESGAVLSTRDACAVLGISENTLRKHRRAGLIKPTLKGCEYLGEQVNRLWENHKKGIC